MWLSGYVIMWLSGYVVDGRLVKKAKHRFNQISLVITGNYSFIEKQITEKNFSICQNSAFKESPFENPGPHNHLTT